MNSYKKEWPWALACKSSFHRSCYETNGTLGSDPEALPKISVITPSFNQGHFIEETIRSVLLQDYPNLEYIIVDGGSTDESVSIIKRFEPWLTYWVSEPDRGQSHAINKGFEVATGQLVAYLNSDDIYLPGALWQIAKAWVNSPDSVVFVGGFVHVDERSDAQSKPKWPLLPSLGPIDLSLLSHEAWRLPQQPGFFSKSALEGDDSLVCEDLHYTMDRELYCRLLRRGKACFVDDVLATYRLHEMSKTCSSIMKMYQEDKKAIAKSKTGSSFEDFRRSLVGRGWVGRGYWKFANLEDIGRSERLRSLVGVALNAPKYLKKKQFWRLLASCFGIDTMVLKSKIIGVFKRV